MGCGGSAGPYPAEIPAAAALPAGIEVLHKKDTEAVERAINLSARSFAGTAKAPPAMEFDWMLKEDAPDREADLQERVSRLEAMIGFCVHKAFVLGQRGLVLQAKPGAWESSDAKTDDGKAVGVAVLYFYPKKWPADGMMAEINAAGAAGMSKWTKAQKAFLEGKKMKALEAVMKTLRKEHGSTAHIYVQVMAVHPDNQSQGVGGKLMRAVSAIADAAGLPLYLETEPTKEGFYKKCGYAVVGKGEPSVTVNGVADPFSGGMIAMRREPASK
jgi:GNAT superfamily N-acetyltransferase